MALGRSEILAVIDQVATEQTVPYTWLAAIARQESNFNPSAKNTDGSDGARGGAWGLCQITLATARALGYSGPPEGLLDVRTNLTLAAQLIKKAMESTPTLSDVAAMFNSGMPFSLARQVSLSDPNAERRQRFAATVRVYVPRILRFHDAFLRGKVDV